MNQITFEQLRSMFLGKRVQITNAADEQHKDVTGVCTFIGEGAILECTLIEVSFECYDLKPQAITDNSVVGSTVFDPPNHFRKITVVDFTQEQADLIEKLSPVFPGKNLVEIAGILMKSLE